jgi:cysteine desulfurase
VACQEAADWCDDTNIETLRDYFWDRLRNELGERVKLNGHLTHRLPNTLNVSFEEISGFDLLNRLPLLAASTGSACHSGKQHLSPVLTAMGMTVERCLGAVRFSLGRSTSKQELESVVSTICKQFANTSDCS